MKTCPKCQNPIHDNYLFCPNCGANLKNCPHCGKELPEGANFCPYCGKSTTTETCISGELLSGNIGHIPQVNTANLHTSKPTINRNTVTQLPGLNSRELLIIPKGTKAIDRLDYSGKQNLKQIILPEGLESIGYGAFDNCKNLIKINLPASLKKMAPNIFRNCEGLKSAGPYGSGCSIEFGATEQILEDMFYNCQHLERFIFPDSIKSIGRYAFWNCRSLDNFTLPDSIEKIGTAAFHGCDRLCDKDGFVIIHSVLHYCIRQNPVISIPQGVTQIEPNAFFLHDGKFNHITEELIVPDSVVCVPVIYEFEGWKKLERITASENASMAVKDLANKILKRTKDRQLFKEQLAQKVLEEAMRISDPNKLSVFYEANKANLSMEEYWDILTRFRKKRNEVINPDSDTHSDWKETENMISLSDSYEQWVWHDETECSSITLTFSKAKTVDNNVEWSTESEWPCSGQALLFDKSWSSAPDNWNYTYVTHKAWLLKEPYGMPGIWQFEYNSKIAR